MTILDAGHNDLHTCPKDVSYEVRANFASQFTEDVSKKVFIYPICSWQPICTSFPHFPQFCVFKIVFPAFLSLFSILGMVVIVAFLM